MPDWTCSVLAQNLSICNCPKSAGIIKKMNSKDSPICSGTCDPRKFVINPVTCKYVFLKCKSLQWNKWNLNYG